MSDAILEKLAEALGPIIDQQKGRRFNTVFKHDTTGTPGAVYSHGPGGLLTFPGVDPTVFNATMGGATVLNQIPFVPSLYSNPTYMTITGVQDVTGSEMTDVCSNAPTAGLMKGCMTTAPFGRYERATPLLDIGRLGERTDRADPIDLRLANSPLALGAGGPFGISDGAPTDVLTNEIARKFWERNVAFQRLLARQVWAGTPANNSAGQGYKEFPGLAALVNTGYKDAETGSTCAAMDSYVANFGYARVGGANDQIVAALTNIYHQVKERARRAGVMPVRWAFAMRPDLFYELTAIWPCSYLSYRCQAASTSTPAMIDASDAIKFRDEMRAGSYLLIDGDRIDVIQDDGITEKDGNSSGGSFPKGDFSSDIYLLPFSVVGGQSVLYGEYMQYSNPSIQDALGNMVLARIEGAFITWPRQTNLCVQWQSRIEPRIVLRTPWLAARLQNVVYGPIEHTRETFPNEPYFVNGGKTSRPGPSFYSLWQS